MGERIEAIIDALRSAPEDAFGCVPDTPDQQGWWIRDELIDSACKVREEVEQLQKVVKAAFDLLPQSPNTAKTLLSGKSSGGKVALRTTAEAKEDGDE